MMLALAIAGIPAFVASVVEFVEAFTIVLAVGNTRGWHSPAWGTLAAIGSLAAIVALFGTPLVLYHDQISEGFHLVVGLLLLLFGMRWLRKALLRFAGIVALHDEELIYQREVAELRAQGLHLARWDRIGFWFSYKAVLLEGLEVAFIVITLGAQGPDALLAATIGAVTAFVLTMVAGALLRKPLTVVPENTMKYAVGAMLTTFGVYWGAEGYRIHWAMGPTTLLLLFAGICAVSWLGARMLAFMAPHAAGVPSHSV